MALSAAEQALAQTIQQARTSKTLIAGKNGDHGVDLAGAYRVQVALQGERVLKGYKLGLVSVAKQQQMGVTTPIYGRIYADAITQKKVSLSDFIQPRVEPEVVAVLRDAIAPDANAGVVTQAVGGYFLGVDILDSVWQDYQFTAEEVVADNSSGGGFLLARRMGDSLAGGLLRLYLNGELQTEGHTDALGNPIQRLQWLAQQVDGLAAGAIVFFGSPAASFPLTARMLEVTGLDGHSLIAKIAA
jgi:2-oxo-3-hexenedioate decarboxylase